MVLPLAGAPPFLSGFGHLLEETRHYLKHNRVRQGKGCVAVVVVVVVSKAEAMDERSDSLCVAA